MKRYDQDICVSRLGETHTWMKMDENGDFVRYEDMIDIFVRYFTDRQQALSISDPKGYVDWIIKQYAK